jgi:hypothetical protein
MRIRTASPEDAARMSQMLQKLIAAGKRSARADVEFVQHHYMGHPSGVRCSLAEDADRKSTWLSVGDPCER